MVIDQKVIVGVGDYWVTNEKEKTLVTYSLGSCVGVTAFDKKAGVGGILHFKLPHSELNPAMAAARPAVFGDTGLTAFLEGLFKLGATRPQLEVKLAGGAQAMNGGSFNIGERNLLLARRFLWMNGLLVSKEDTGGHDYRTLRLEMATGRVMLQDPRGAYEL